MLEVISGNILKIEIIDIITKFESTSLQQEIREMKTPKLAKSASNSRKHLFRKDWHSIKDDVMRIGLMAKFQQNKKLKSLLLETGDAELIENSPTDMYWGCGSSGQGENKLGKLLMEVRTKLKNIENKSKIDQYFKNK